MSLEDTNFTLLTRLYLFKKLNAERISSLFREVKLVKSIGLDRLAVDALKVNCGGGIDRDTGFQRNKFKPPNYRNRLARVPSARNLSLDRGEYRAGTIKQEAEIGANR